MRVCLSLHPNPSFAVSRRRRRRSKTSLENPLGIDWDARHAVVAAPKNEKKQKNDYFITRMYVKK